MIAARSISSASSLVTPIMVGLLVLTINAWLSVRDLLTRGDYMWRWAPNTSWADSSLAFAASWLIMLALLLRLPRPAMGWAKAAVAFLSVSPLLWHGLAWPAFWEATYLQDCGSHIDCSAAQLQRRPMAMADFTQAQIAIALTNIAALVCATGAAMSFFASRKV